MDEFEFEVVPTGTGAPRSVRAPRRISPLPRPPRTVTVALIVACVAVVTVGLAFASVPNLSSSVGVLLQGTPTATPRIPPGGSLLFVEGAVPWGKLTIDGKVVTIGQASPDTTVQMSQALTRGTHAVVYEAGALPKVNCRFSVPVRKTDNCPLDPTYAYPDKKLVPAGRTLNVTPTLDALPAAARASLLQMINASVATQSTTTVQPGERYVNGARQIVYADQQLRATLTQRLATSASATVSCVDVCMPVPGPYAVGPHPVEDFVVDAHVTQHYAYATTSGQTLLADAPVATHSDGPNDELVEVVVTWGNGAWQVAFASSTAQSSNSACLAGWQALHYYAVDSRDNQVILGSTAGIPAANPADGCVFRIANFGGYIGTPPPSTYTHLLYRFGVMLAFNDADDVEAVANAYLLRGMPFADDAETALGWQIDATQPYD